MFIGGQYHWVSEFAPRSSQKFLSYMVGWISTLGWQTGLASLAFIVGTVIQGLIVLNNPSYVFERWHGTLLVIAIVSFSVIFNTFLAHRLPMVEGIALVIHILGFFAILIPLWVLAPHGNAKDVFTTFTNFGGWPTTGTSVMVGMLSSVYALLGVDSAVHMCKSHFVLHVNCADRENLAEEIQDASIVLPKITMWAIAVNGFFGFVMMITFCFCLGDPFAAIDSLTGYPFIEVFYSGTGSLAGASVMVAVMIITITSSVISSLAAVSRQSWSFARDGGLPFASFIGYVKPGWNIPLNAVLLTWLITCLLSLINIGSTVAFNAISSSATVSLISTYIISISCLVIKRLRGHTFPHHRWSLGKAGLFINLAALAYLLTIWVFLFFPISTPVDAATMNWNSLIYGGTIVFAVIYYFLFGRKSYVPPVALVVRDHVA